MSAPTSSAAEHDSGAGTTDKQRTLMSLLRPSVVLSAIVVVFGTGIAFNAPAAHAVAELSDGCTTANDAKYDGTYSSTYSGRTGWGAGAKAFKAGERLAWSATLDADGARYVVISTGAGSSTTVIVVSANDWTDFEAGVPRVWSYTVPADANYSWSWGAGDTPSPAWTFSCAGPKSDQSITFDPTTTGTVGGSQTLSASSDSNLSVEFAVAADSGDGVCSLSNDTLSYTGAGTCKVTASQAGDDTFNPATPVTKSITVTKKTQQITFTPKASGVVGTSQTLSPTSDSGLTVALEIDPSSTAGACSLSGSVLSYDGVGSCVVKASQAGDDTFEAAEPVTRTIRVDPADTDGDGLKDTLEKSLGSNPKNTDSDGDGLKDGTEYRGFTMTKTVVTPDGKATTIGKIKTNLVKADTDGDGLTDRVEVAGTKVNQKVNIPGKNKYYYLKLLQSNPTKKDTDGDGLTDKVEVTGSANQKFKFNKSDPSHANTDRGSRNDGYEIGHGTDPANT